MFAADTYVIRMTNDEEARGLRAASANWTRSRRSRAAH